MVSITDAATDCEQASPGSMLQPSDKGYMERQKISAPFPVRIFFIIRKSKCSTDFKRNDFLKKTKRTHWVRFVHLNSLIESCVFLYLWNSPFDTFL